MCKMTDLERAEARVRLLEGKLSERQAEVGQMRLSHEVWQQHSDEDIAQMFHLHYERLSPRFGYETRMASRVNWLSLTGQMRHLMTATVTAVRHAMVAKARGALNTPAPKEPTDG